MVTRSKCQSTMRATPTLASFVAPYVFAGGVPASISNDLPATDLSIGSDTALNSIVGDIDKIKDSATRHSCFIVEVMGQGCGYLALLSGLATGAEQVYLPEEGISLEGLRADLHSLRTRFADSNRLSVLVRSEKADEQIIFVEERGQIRPARPEERAEETEAQPA